MEGEKRFGQAVSSRRRASLARILFRRCTDCAHLLVHDKPALARAGGGTVREIPLDAITGTLEPGRAREFDSRVPARRRACASAGCACGWPSTPAPASARSRSSRSATSTRSATGTTACRSPAPAAP